MDTTVPTRWNLWPTADESYNIWPTDLDLDNMERKKQVLHILQSTLQLNAVSTEARVERIVKDIYFMVGTTEESDGYQQSVYGEYILWETFWDMTKTLPYDHLYSEILLRALVILQENEDADDRKKKARKDRGEDEGNPDEYFPSIYYSYIAQNEKFNLLSGRELHVSFEDWKKHCRNFTSFAARLGALGHQCSFMYTMADIRDALEKAIIIGHARLPCLETQLWMATEFIWRNGKFIYTKLTTSPDINREDARPYDPGELCSDIHPFGLERWEFWQKRLIEISADAEKFQLSSSMVARLVEVLKHMDAVKHAGA
ncbi:hypothetical protein ACMFMG_004507 [Clarireedia jacksonii]